MVTPPGAHHPAGMRLCHSSSVRVEGLRRSPPHHGGGSCIAAWTALIVRSALAPPALAPGAVACAGCRASSGRSLHRSGWAPASRLL